MTPPVPTRQDDGRRGADQTATRLPLRFGHPALEASRRQFPPSRRPAACDRGVACARSGAPRAHPGRLDLTGRRRIDLDRNSGPRTKLNEVAGLMIAVPTTRCRFTNIAVPAVEIDDREPEGLLRILQNPGVLTGHRSSRSGSYRTWAAGSRPTRAGPWPFRSESLRPDWLSSRSSGAARCDAFLLRSGAGEIGAGLQTSPAHACKRTHQAGRLEHSDASLLRGVTHYLPAWMARQAGYCTNSTFPKAPFASSSGPAAKYKTSGDPDPVPIPNPMAQRPSILISPWSSRRRPRGRNSPCLSTQ